MKLYFEEHNDTAVIFASLITDGEDIEEEKFLSLMNAYIIEFDKVSRNYLAKPDRFKHILDLQLTNRKEFQSVEKIKIAKWTYLAACGLFDCDQPKTKYENLETSIKFVSEMFKKLKKVNQDTFQTCKLRVGKL